MDLQKFKETYTQIISESADNTEDTVTDMFNEVIKLNDHVVFAGNDSKFISGIVTGIDAPSDYVYVQHNNKEYKLESSAVIIDKRSILS